MREMREIEMIDVHKEKCDSKQESSTILDLLTFPPQQQQQQWQQQQQQQQKAAAAAVAVVAVVVNFFFLKINLIKSSRWVPLFLFLLLLLTTMW